MESSPGTPAAGSRAAGQREPLERLYAATTAIGSTIDDECAEGAPERSGYSLAP